MIEYLTGKEGSDIFGLSKTNGIDLGTELDFWLEVGNSEFTVTDFSKDTLIFLTGDLTLLFCFEFKFELKVMGIFGGGELFFFTFASKIKNTRKI